MPGKTNRIIGHGYNFCDNLKTSVANANILSQPDGMTVYKLEFNNRQDCHVIITSCYGDTYNGFIGAGEGFRIALGDVPINSLKIVEAGIQYTFKAYYTQGVYV